MDDALAQQRVRWAAPTATRVLILVVMDDALAPKSMVSISKNESGMS